MIAQSVTLTHPRYPDLEVTFAAPTEEAWGAAIDTLSTSRSKEAGMLAAGYNLVIAMGKGVSSAEAPRLIDDWPALTTLAIGKAAELGGALRVESEADPASVNAWRFDLAATVAAAKEIASLKNVGPDELAAHAAGNRTEGEALETARADRYHDLLSEHGPTLEAIAASGLALENCSDLLARFNRRGQLLALRTLDHGVVIARRPTFQASLAYANDSTDSGAYEAGKRLCLACVVSPIEGAIAPRLSAYPAFTSTLAGLIRGTSNEGMAATVKKG